MPRGESGRRWLPGTVLGLLVALLFAAPAFAVERAANLPPDADPLATIMVVAFGAVLVSAWTTYRDRRSRRP